MKKSIEEESELLGENLDEKFFEIQDKLLEEFGHPSFGDERLNEISRLRLEIENWLTNVGLATLGFFLTGLIQIKLRGEITLIESLMATTSLFSLLISISIGFYSKLAFYFQEISNSLLPSKRLAGYFLSILAVRMFLLLQARGLDPIEYLDQLKKETDDFFDELLVESSQFSSKTDDGNSDAKLKEEIGFSDCQETPPARSKSPGEAIDQLFGIDESKRSGDAVKAYKFITSLTGLTLQLIFLLSGIFILSAFIILFLLSPSESIFSVLYISFIFVILLVIVLFAKSIISLRRRLYIGLVKNLNDTNN